MCGKYFKMKRGITKHMQKSTSIFWLPVKDIQIPDIFYKIQQFLNTSWASVLAQRFTGPNYLDVDTTLSMSIQAGSLPR